jgi:hypothetical protein
MQLVVANSTTRLTQGEKVKHMSNLVRKIGYLTAVAVLFFGSSALAYTVDMNFTGVGGNNLDGVYVYPYDFTVSGDPAKLMCDDYGNEISIPESWNARVTDLGSLTASNIASSGLYFASLSNALQDYQEVGWLAQQMILHNGNDAAQADINWAIWSIMDSNSPPNGTDPGAAAWMALAASNYKGGNYWDVDIYTPTIGNALPLDKASGPQEFLGVDSVPEAHTSALLGAGLLGLVALMLYNGWDPVAQGDRNVG